MITLSATDAALANAIVRQTIVLSLEHNARLDMDYIAISDEVGLIEVHPSWGAANDRVRAVEGQLAAKGLLPEPELDAEFFALRRPAAGFYDYRIGD